MDLQLTRPEMLEIITRMLNLQTENEHELDFWERMLEKHLDPEIRVLIRWPGTYFGDGDNSREMSPEEILEVALKSKERRIILPDKT